MNVKNELRYCPTIAMDLLRPGLLGFMFVDYPMNIFLVLDK